MPIVDAMQMSEKPGEDGGPPGPVASTEYDLKFVPLEELREGGWYRELPGDQIEVMSHARLQRVPLGDADPEQKAREIVADIVKQQKA